jgi:hypothetical protein
MRVINQAIWDRIVKELCNKIREQNIELYNMKQIETPNMWVIQKVGGIYVKDDKLKFLLWDGNSYKTVAIYDKFWEGDILYLLKLNIATFCHAGLIVYKAEIQNNQIIIYDDT